MMMSYGSAVIMGHRMGMLYLSDQAQDADHDDTVRDGVVQYVDQHEHDQEDDIDAHQCHKLHSRIESKQCQSFISLRLSEGDRTATVKRAL